MQPISTVTGRACPIDINDVDTDLIIPKQFLKSIKKTGFGPYAFSERRFLDDGSPDPTFPINKPEHAGAPVLLSRRNFGCGSSREHAAWALQDAGFDAIIASSFGDIFSTNCGKIGVVCVRLEEDTIQSLFDLVQADPANEITVDLREQRVRASGVAGLPGVDVSFDIDPHTRHCLLNGLDDIALTLEHEGDIASYESSRAGHRPRVPAA